MTATVTCPFCSLLCDDLSVRASGSGLTVSANACQRARQGFGLPAPATEARIAGVVAPLERAVTRAAQLLQKSRKALLGGLGTDVNGLRAALRLAERTDAALWHEQEPYARQNLKALQSRGGIMTTLGEVKNRADTVLFIGNNVTDNHPRFIERCINPAHALFAGKHRKLGYLGKPGRTELADCEGHELVTLTDQGNGLANHLALLRAALTQPQWLAAAELPAPKRNKLKQLVDMVGNAQYGALVWSPAALPQDQADLIIHACLDLLRDLNVKQRFAGLSLGGNNGGVSWQSVATWQTGFPAGVNFTNGRPSANGVQAADADCLLWVSGFNRQPPPALAVPTIILSPHQAGASAADVYLPTGVPGIDHGGNLFRTDGVIALPLQKLRDRGAPSAAEVIEQIVERL
ncbi:MAG: hypothetical protein OXE97_05905 [Gammaproteobacteria bacterium]|nr:hypothetical protein [Gammaproteobacteria bacterium]MCY4281430.1 hypothetical protein [Gammaproteobacteria bacterium]